MAYKNPYKLPPKQLKFCYKYVELNNGTQAAIQAGYSPHTANVTSSQLLIKPNIQRQIQDLQGEIQKNTIATGQQVMEYFTRVMNGEEADQFGIEASLSERTKAAQELAKRTIDLENRLAGHSDNKIEISIDWKR